MSAIKSTTRKIGKKLSRGGVYIIRLSIEDFMHVNIRLNGGEDRKIKEPRDRDRYFANAVAPAIKSALIMTI